MKRRVKMSEYINDALCDAYDIQKSFDFKKIADKPKDNDGTSITLKDCIDNIVETLEARKEVLAEKERAEKADKSNFCCAREKLFTSGTVQDLIDVLELVEDKSLPIRVIEQGREDEGVDNFWLCDIEVSNTSSSGYEQSGEVRLIGGE